MPNNLCPVGEGVVWTEEDDLINYEGSMGYYNSDKTNPNWFAMWEEQIKNGADPEDVMDQIAELACGIKVGASDACQQYAKHIRTHIKAAFLAGSASKE